MRVFGTTSHQPMIVSQHLNRLRSLAILTGATWRWRLLGKGLSDATGTQAPDVYSSFVSNAVQWLTSSDDDKMVRVQAVKPTFAPSEPVGIGAEIHDEKYAAIDDAVVDATVSGASGTFTVVLEPKGNGRYFGEVSRLPEGDYTISGTARLRDRALGTDNGKFIVADMAAEFQDLRMNATLLRSIASQTGGAFATTDKSAQLIDSLFANPRVAPATTLHKSEIELWSNAWLLAIALGMFCIEWIARKRLGLL
jgi:hypothetical protein